MLTVFRKINLINLLEILFRVKLALFKKKHIVIACFPKSASTYLTQLLVDCTGFDKTYWKQHGGASQNFLHIPKVVSDLSSNVVVQQHFKFNTANFSILKRMNGQVVVLTRDIYDVIVSFLDQIEKDKKGPFQDEPLYFFENLSYEKKIDYVILNVCPWYIGFYASWKYAQREEKLPVLFITYDELVNTPIDTTGNVLKFYNIEVDNITEKLSHIKDQKINFNQGKKGRGKMRLSEEQMNKVKELTRFYPDVDFLEIGIK